MRFFGMFRFTFGEAIRKGTLIFYFGFGTLILMLFAFGIGRLPEDHEIITFFGNPISITTQGPFNVIDFILLQMHSASVFWIILLGTIGIAGMIPRMLDKGTIELFLSKPLSRGGLLLARAMGAVSGVALNLLYFFIGLWCIFGVKLGVWHWGFLSSMLCVIYAFICFFSVVAIVGLITRSTGFSIILAFLFAFVSWIIGVRGTGFLYIISDNTIYRFILDSIYYSIPQLHPMLHNSALLIGKNPFDLTASEFSYMPYVYSLISTSVLYLLSIWYFSRRDY